MKASRHLFRRCVSSFGRLFCLTVFLRFFLGGEAECEVEGEAEGEGRESSKDMIGCALQSNGQSRQETFAIQQDTVVSRLGDSKSSEQVFVRTKTYYIRATHMVRSAN